MTRHLGVGRGKARRTGRRDLAALGGDEGVVQRRGRGRVEHVTAVARVKGQASPGTPNMAAAGVVVAGAAASSLGAPAGTAARARRPPSGPPARLPPLLVLLAAAAGPGAGGAARLYRAGEDAVWVLDSGSVRGATANSSAAWLVQFYSSWCGHCIGYAPTWRALARDVQGEARRTRCPDPGPGPRHPPRRPFPALQRTPLRPSLACALGTLAARPPLRTVGSFRGKLLFQIGKTRTLLPRLSFRSCPSSPDT